MALAFGAGKDLLEQGSQLGIRSMVGGWRWPIPFPHFDKIFEEKIKALLKSDCGGN